MCASVLVLLFKHNKLLAGSFFSHFKAPFVGGLFSNFQGYICSLSSLKKSLYPANTSEQQIGNFLVNFGLHRRMIRK